MRMRTGALAVGFGLLLACGDSKDTNVGTDNGGEAKGGAMATDFTTRDIDGNTFR